MEILNTLSSSILYISSFSFTLVTQPFDHFPNSSNSTLTSCPDTVAVQQYEHPLLPMAIS